MRKVFSKVIECIKLRCAEDASRDRPLIFLKNPNGDTAIGTCGEIQPDGTAELILTEEGQQKFGRNLRVKLLGLDSPDADEPVIAEAKS